MLSPAVDSLVAQLARLPGVGQRTAQRLAFHLLRVPAEEALALAEAIRIVKERVGFCSECFNLSEEPLCAFCPDPRRDRTLICVVEAPSDIVPLERTAEYRGLYHVLGGALSPIDGVDPEHLRIAELLARVERAGDELREVVLATNPDDDGRGDRPVRRRAPARQGEGHAARERAAGRRRPRVRRRGHARPRARRPSRALRAEVSWVSGSRAFDAGCVIPSRGNRQRLQSRTCPAERRSGRTVTDDYDFRASERRRARELDELEARRLHARERQRAQLRAAHRRRRL